MLQSYDKKPELILFNKDKQMNLELSQEEVQAILNVLGELPTKSGAFPLVVKINEQFKDQLPKSEEKE